MSFHLSVAVGEAPSLQKNNWDRSRIVILIRGNWVGVCVGVWIKIGKLSFRHIEFVIHTWKDEILLELHSAFAFTLSHAIDPVEKWKILSLSTGAVNLSINSSALEIGRRTREGSRSPNHHWKTWGSEIQSLPCPPLLAISNHNLKNARKKSHP